MIDTMKLKFGSSSSSEPLEIKLEPITIFIGPNNAGKSIALNEIFSGCTSNTQSVLNKIIDEMTFLPIEKIDEEITKFTLPARPNEIISDDEIRFGKINGEVIKTSTLKYILENPNKNKSSFCRSYLEFNTSKVDSANRFTLINNQRVNALYDNSRQTIHIIFLDNEKRKSLRDIIYKAFKLYLVVYAMNSDLQIKLSKKDPGEGENSIEKSIGVDANAFFTESISLGTVGDGVKAFIGLMLKIIADDSKITIIDEPAAYLHPSLASMLGKDVCKASKDNSKRLFMSTHSAFFLAGCIQSKVPLNIIRLTYTNELPTARLLKNEQLLILMRDPLLRSMGVLNALFYEFVIVVEGDSDRAFYQEINERLLDANDSRGIPNCLFINAHNKQTLHKIIKPLRDIGIPCAAIADIDVIKEGGTVWTKLLSSINVPEDIKKSTDNLRASLEIKLKAKGDYKKDGGITLLDDESKNSCNHLFEQLDGYGLFTVRNGELESWLKGLGILGEKTAWLIAMFEKLGDDPNESNYIKPADNDVWVFLGLIKKWLINADRKGIPN